MSTPARRQRGHPLPSFEGEAQAFPEEERAGESTALAIAIAEASTAAAGYIAEHELGTMTFEVTRIRVVVAPNPGPTTYRAVITPGG
jgi:hypothetical protein